MKIAPNPLFCINAVFKQLSEPLEIKDKSPIIQLGDSPRRTLGSIQHILLTEYRNNM